jgi:release factor glutamine methyltransferase
VVHSSLLGLDPTIDALRAHGLAVDVAARERGPLGPLMAGRRAHLEASGMLAPDQQEEEVLVVRARNAPCARCSPGPLGSRM